VSNSSSLFQTYNYDIAAERAARAQYALQEEQEELAAYARVKHAPRDPSRKPQITLAASEQDMNAAMTRSHAQGSMASLLAEGSLPPKLMASDTFEGTVRKVEAKVHNAPAAVQKQASISAPSKTGGAGAKIRLAESQEPSGATNIVAIVVISLAILCIAAAFLVMTLTIHGTKQVRAPPDRRAATATSSDALRE